jgi:hypothetical protein
MTVEVCYTPTGTHCCWDEFMGSTFFSPPAATYGQQPTTTTGPCVTERPLSSQGQLMEALLLDLSLWRRR